LGVEARGRLRVADNIVDAALASANPAWPTSTWGGGSGITVIYGVATPVKPPRMGKVRMH
jgi:hypothetical protein